MKLEIKFYDRFLQLNGSPDFPCDLKDKIEKAIRPIVEDYFNKKNLWL